MINHYLSRFRSLLTSINHCYQLFISKNPIHIYLSWSITIYQPKKRYSHLLIMINHYLSTKKTLSTSLNHYQSLFISQKTLFTSILIIIDHYKTSWSKILPRLRRPTLPSPSSSQLQRTHPMASRHFEATWAATVRSPWVRNFKKAMENWKITIWWGNSY